MDYLVRIGPLSLGEQAESTVYLRVSEEGEASAPSFSTGDDVEGLKPLLEGDLSELRCEPELADAAKALGLEVAEPPDEVKRIRALMAVYFSWGLAGLGELGSDRAVAITDAFRALYDANPLVHWEMDARIEVRVTGTLKREYDVALLEFDDELVGLRLFTTPGDHRRYVTLLDEDKTEEADKLPGLELALSTAPEFACRALEEAGYPSYVPFPILCGAETELPSREETLVLVALTQALSEMTKERNEATLELSEDGTRVRLWVRAPGKDLPS